MPRKEDNVPATLRAISVLEALVAADQPASLAELTDALVTREPGARATPPDEKTEGSCGESTYTRPPGYL